MRYLTFIFMGVDYALPNFEQIQEVAPISEPPSPSLSPQDGPNASLEIGSRENPVIISQFPDNGSKDNPLVVE